jgi:hypothetical protein
MVTHDFNQWPAYGLLHRRKQQPGGRVQPADPALLHQNEALFGVLSKDRSSILGGFGSSGTRSSRRTVGASLSSSPERRHLSEI